MSTESNKRIAKNTLFLYFRMMFTMAVALYTSRVILAVLGESDYGLYNVVGGIVAMFSMISCTLASGTQRFLTYAIGENDFDKLRKTFSISLGLHLAVAVIILLLAETAGVWFLLTQLSIPDGRMTAAFWVYQFSVISFVVGIIQIPFMSSLIAHERMDMYAYMTVYDVVMKLFIVFLVQWLAYDKLILYGFLLLVVGLTSTAIYNYYCQTNFKECRLHLMWDTNMAKEIVAFSGWNIFGSSLCFFSGQGINILLNIFFGTIVNAARGISNTVNGCILGFVSNFQMAVNPQIVKLYAAGKKDELYRLVVNNSRAAEYLFLFIAIPAFIEIDFVLSLWLGEYPEYTAVFVKIVLLQSAFQTVNRPFVALVHATGKMKWPNLTAGISLMMMFPISYFALRLGATPITVYWICTIVWTTDNIWDIWWPHHYAGIPISMVLRKVYGNIIVGVVVMFTIPWVLSMQMEDGWARFFVIGSVSVITSTFVFYAWGATPGMRELIKKRLNDIVHKIRK